MKNYIKTLCARLNIKVIFTSNKITVLSSSIKNGNPTLRVHKIFINCTKKVAESVIGYYTDLDSRIDYLLDIEEYLEDNFKSIYKIKTPDKIFKQAVGSIKSKGLSKQSQRSFKELKIKKMIQSDLLGNTNEIASCEPIEISSSNVIRLDIIVDYPESG